MSRVDAILDFWFEGLTDDKPLDKDSKAVKKWFIKDKALDAEIREKFEGDYIKARGGEYKEWESAACNLLALVILFDQFSRNMYRDTPKIFETDSLALGLALRAIKEKTDGELKLMERIFLYMPLMHAEDIANQRLSLKCFQNLVTESKSRSPQNSGYYEYTLSFAKRHHAIIERFGRFPHRNSILGRSTTKEEREFLTKSGRHFKEKNK